MTDNLLTELESLVSNLLTLSNLKSLSVSGNPFQMYSAYYFYPISILNLDYFNDFAISVEEKAAADEKIILPDSEVDKAQIIFKIESLTGLKPEEFNGNIRIKISSPFGQTFLTSSTPGKPLHFYEKLAFAIEFLSQNFYNIYD